MEYFRKDDQESREMDIAFSRSVKAGKRIYYLDVKRSKNEDLYLCLTESKKKVSGDPASPDVSYEKHKIFLYREDLSKFTEALIDVIRFMQENDQPENMEEPVCETLAGDLGEALADSGDTSLLDDDPPIRLNLGDFE